MPEHHPAHDSQPEDGHHQDTQAQDTQPAAPRLSAVERRQAREEETFRELLQLSGAREIPSTGRRGVRLGGIRLDRARWLRLGEVSFACGHRSSGLMIAIPGELSMPDGSRTFSNVRAAAEWLRQRAEPGDPGRRSLIPPGDTRCSGPGGDCPHWSCTSNGGQDDGCCALLGVRDSNDPGFAKGESLSLLRLKLRLPQCPGQPQGGA